MARWAWLVVYAQQALDSRYASSVKGYFVTGTGTGVGKTFITAALARHAVSVGKRVFAFKPIETGCRRMAGGMVGEDQELLAVAAGNWQQGELRNLYCFERPIAPIAAAKAEAKKIDFQRIEAVFARGSTHADLVLVEGAGGWRVPITESEDMSSLARRLELPVVVVALAGLGTINHSVLTVEAVRRDGCEVAMVVLSLRPNEDAEFAAENAAEIRRLSGARTHVSREKVLGETLSLMP